MSPEQDTYTYRGRSLDELVPKIREDLGDDAVIVGRRETTSGGVGGFFARREIEVEVRPGESVAAAQAFAQQLAQAHERQQHDDDDEPRLRPAVSHEIDALPSAADVTVDDLFPAPPPRGQGLAALFNAGLEVAPPQEPAAPEPRFAHEPPAVAEPLAVEDAPAVEEPPAVQEAPAAQEAPALEEPQRVEEPPSFAPPPPAPEAAPPVAEPTIFAVDQPTGAFDYVVPVELPTAEPAVAPEASEPEPAVAPQPFAAAEPVIPSAARAAAERLAARGLRPELAEVVAEEAITSLLPLSPGADPKALVVDALARRIPVHALRRGRGVVGFVGPGGAGKTRCVARLAAAHARHGALPVSVVALRSPDQGAELTRLLAPYGVTLHAVESGAEGAARIATLRGEGLVVLDTPGVSPRAQGELRALGAELAALAPDELHLTIPATIGADAARELVAGVRELGVGALALTHTDETEQLGTVIGLAIESGLPLSYLARGQAVEAGLRPASAAELAASLVP